MLHVDEVALEAQPEAVLEAVVLVVVHLEVVEDHQVEEHLEVVVDHLEEEEEHQEAVVVEVLEAQRK